MKSFCKKYGLPSDGLDQLPNRGGAWIIPGFTMDVKDQREMSTKMKKLIDIFKSEIHGALDDINNTLFSIVFNRVETSPNMQIIFYKMSQLAEQTEV